MSLNCTHCGKRELDIWLKHFACWEESNLGVIENNYFLWGSERKYIK